MKRRYIFIDGGSHRGESIEWFERSAIFSQYSWEIFAFEPNSVLIPSISSNICASYLTILNKAMWTYDGTIGFYLGKETDGSSVLSCKRVGGLSKVPIKVDCVNFGQWIKRNFTHRDYILVKLDIEGAEYKVLDQMLNDDTIFYIDALFVEFHNRMVKVPVQRDIDLIEILKELDIPCWTLGRFSKLLKEAITNNKLKGLEEEKK